MKGFTRWRIAPFRSVLPTRASSSRVSASWSTATSGPFPERYTARASPNVRLRVATFKPTSVFPAPGTPVTNTMAFS